MCSDVTKLQRGDKVWGRPGGRVNGVFKVRKTDRTFREESEKVGGESDSEGELEEYGKGRDLSTRERRNRATRHGRWTLGGRGWRGGRVWGSLGLQWRRSFGKGCWGRVVGGGGLRILDGRHGDKIV